MCSSHGSTKLVCLLIAWSLIIKLIINLQGSLNVEASLRAVLVKKMQDKKKQTRAEQLNRRQEKAEEAENSKSQQKNKEDGFSKFIH